MHTCRYILQPFCEPDANFGILIVIVAFGMGLDYNVYPVVYWGPFGNIYRRLVTQEERVCPCKIFMETDVREFEVVDCMKEYCSNGSNCRHELPKTL